MLDSLTNADHARLSRFAALAACAAAALICLWILVRLAWLLVPPGDESAAPVAAKAAPAAAPAQSVAKWHLFGNPQTVNLALARNTPATTLKLSLRGTLALADPKQGMAVIADEHGSDRAYKIGDEVAAATRLAEVYTDHVVLTHEGVAETLSLPRPEEHAPESADAAQHATAMAGGKASSVPPTYVPPQMKHGALDWSKAQKQLQLDPNELAKQVHLEPVYQNGKLVGARLSAGGQIGALMQQAGLRPTDTVTSVNGASVTDVSNLQRMMDNLKNISSLQVTVLRDGKPATLTMNLQ
jgi:general secretion pathway protein C